MGGAEILHKLALDSASQVIGGIKGGKGAEMNIKGELLRMNIKGGKGL